MLTTVFRAAIVAATLLAAVNVDAQPQQQQQQQQGRPVNPRSFATKTAYWDQRTVDDYDPAVIAMKHRAHEQLQSLKLVQVQQVNRHGTRYPTESNMLEMMSLITKLQANYVSVIPTWLQNYSLPYNVSIEGTLASTGVTELFQFGARTRAAIGADAAAAASLPATFSSDKFILQHTYKSRTKDSAIAFAKSFFTNPQNVTYIEYTKKSDRFLRFFDECPRYNTEVKDNSTANPDLIAYKASKVMATNIATLKTKLRLPADADITVEDVESAFAACAFDIALYNTYTKWCSVVTKQLVDSIDFAEDLENFYEKGPGTTLSYEIAAVLLKDVFAFFTDFVNGKTNVVGNFRFAHAETTLPLMTLIGYGDRTPLRATFTPDAIAFRGFRSSVLAPLGANIDFRLYESKRDASKHFVQVLVNEKVAPVPGCSGEVFCDLSTIAKLWRHYLTEYDFDAECKL